MLKLAAFADEISPCIDQQIATCKANGVMYFELRSVNKINVLDFDADLRKQVKTKLAAAGLGVACIGSPIGKVKINDPFEPHFERFKVAVELAEYFGAGMIRIFSYYPPVLGQDFGSYRGEIVQRMLAKIDYVRGRNLILVHENEKDIYGQGGRNCVDLLAAVNSPLLRAAFDFANFVQVGQRPRDNWPGLKPYVTHIHIKDALLKDGRVVPPGEGDGDLEAILGDAYRSGYRGFLTLEPHLRVAGHSHGETGPELFKLATDRLRGLCARQGIALST